jgi:hypothetical protein
VVFDVLGILHGMPNWPGSCEAQAGRLRGDSRIRVGSSFEADEEIRVGRKTQRFTAVSTITEYDTPRVISLTSMAQGRPRPRRIQWWYRLEPVEGGTRVTERVEVDLGAVLNLVMNLPYSKVRGAAVRAGMARTLENLQRLLGSLIE